MRKKIMCLFEGRHEMPTYVEGAVLHNIRDITDLETMSKQCHESLQDCKGLVLFVTGLTPALMSVVNYCIFNHIPLTLMHWNREDNSYFKQHVCIPVDDRRNFVRKRRKLQAV